MSRALSSRACTRSSFSSRCAPRTTTSTIMRAAASYMWERKSQIQHALYNFFPRQHQQHKPQARRPDSPAPTPSGSARPHQKLRTTSVLLGTLPPIYVLLSAPACLPACLQNPTLCSRRKTKHSTNDGSLCAKVHRRRRGVLRSAKLTSSTSRRQFPATGARESTIFHRHSMIRKAARAPFLNERTNERRTNPTQPPPAPFPVLERFRDHLCMLAKLSPARTSKTHVWKLIHARLFLHLSTRPPNLCSPCGSEHLRHQIELISLLIMVSRCAIH